MVKYGHPAKYISLLYSFSLRISAIHSSGFTGSVPEMRIWSNLLIESDLKWCIHLSRSLFFIFVGLEEKALREMPTEMEMGRLASHLGKDNFITTAAELCLDLPTRQQIEADHPDSITKRMFYALHTWRRCSSEDRPDFRTLREMLLNLNMDEHILCKVEYSDTFENLIIHIRPVRICSLKKQSV